MMPSNRMAVGLLLAACAALAPFTIEAQVGTDLAGKWTLNRDLSQIPKEVGFSPDWLTAAGNDSGTGGGGGGGGRGGRGGRGGGGGSRTPAAPAHFESADEARLVQQMTAEIRNPPAQLTIAADSTSVTVTGAEGRSRTFHPDGRTESLAVENLTVGVTASGDPERLIVVYKVEQGRELKYTFARTANPPRLTVDVQFAGRGGGDLVKYVYEPAKADADAARSASQATQPPAGVPAAPRPAGQPAAPVVNQRPGAELKGLNKLGVVVEELGSQAAACGLKHDVIESAVTKQLSDAAFTVARNSDEDSYVYVNISTASISSGVCVSRYDVFIYTHATATLSYQSAPSLVQVSLLHRGGLAGGTPAAHPNDVLKGVQEYLGQFITRIRDASK